jgi:hypothetical protein
MKPPVGLKTNRRYSSFEMVEIGTSTGTIKRSLVVSQISDPEALKNQKTNNYFRYVSGIHSAGN